MKNAGINHVIMKVGSCEGAKSVKNYSDAWNARQFLLRSIEKLIMSIVCCMQN